MKILNALILALVCVTLVGSAHAVERTLIPVSNKYMKKVFAFKPKLEIKTTGNTCAEWLSDKGPAKLVLHGAARVKLEPKQLMILFPELTLNTKVSGDQRASLNEALQNGTAKVSVYPLKENSHKARVSIRWKDSQGDHSIKEVLKRNIGGPFTSGTRNAKLSPYKSLINERVPVPNWWF